ncbi:MAG: PIN domain-containing protein [Armatimonadetes bacterium]|nr:PIN domain-containing protein [Armatimonadota bacterium]
MTEFTVFIDTGAFLGRCLRSDQHHSDAARGWKALEKAGRECYTSNFVLDETFTLLGRRASYTFAAERARSFYSSKLLIIGRPAPEDEIAAIGYFEKYADQRVSFTDCVSFVLMRKLGIERAFSFDYHFAAAGFTLWP